MQVNITKRIDTPDGRRFCPAILGAGGRVKPDWVMVNDRQERHPEESVTKRRGPFYKSAPFGERSLF
jgi:hypothetical protein